MKTQTKLLALVVGITGAYLLIALTQHHHQKREIQAYLHERESERRFLFKRFVEVKNAELRAISLDYTTWDEMAGFVGTKNKEWARQNIDPNVFARNGQLPFHLAYIYNHEFQPIYSASLNSTHLLDKSLFSPEEIRAMFTTNRFPDFYVQTPSGIAKIEGAEIHGTNDGDRKGRIYGYALFGREWNDAYLKDLAALSDSTVTLVGADAPPPSPRSKFDISFEIPLLDFQGRKIAMLHVQRSLAALEEFSDYYDEYLSLNLAFAICLLLGLAVSLHHWFVAPLRHITESLNSGSPDPLRHVDPGTNEIARIAELIGRFFRQRDELNHAMDEKTRAEQSIRESEDRFRSLVDQTTDIIIRMNTEGRVLFISPAVKEIFGHPPEDYLADHTLARRQLHPDSLAVFDSIWHHYQRTGSFSESQLELKWIHRDGSVVLAEHTFRNLCDGSGKVVAFQTVARDITARGIADEQVRRVATQLERMTSSIPGAVYQFKLDDAGVMTFPFISAGLMDLFNVSPEEGMRDSSTLIRLIHPEDQPGFEASMRKSARELSAWNYEFRITAPDGKARWIKGVSRPERIAGGVLWHGLLVDITARRAVEERLSEAQRLARIGNWSYDLITGKLWWSEEAYHLFERDAAGPTPSFAEHEKQIHADDLDRWRTVMTRAIERGIPYAIEFRIILLDGTTRNLIGRGQAVRSHVGKVIELNGTIQDITDLRQAEQKLLQSEERYRRILQTASDAIFITDATTGVIVEVNREAEIITGLTDGELTGMPHYKLHPPDNQQLYRGLFQRQVERGLPSTVEVVLRRADGKDIPVEISSSIFEVGGKRFVHSNFRDVSTRKRIESELSQSRKLRAVGELVGGIAHEFNNLLTPMLMQATVISQLHSKDRELIEQLEPMLHAIHEAKELNERILLFGRKSSEKKERVVLADIIRNTTSFLKHAIDRRILVEVDLSTELPPLYANSTALGQILMNLMLNARDTLMDRIATRPPEPWTPCIRVTTLITEAPELPESPMAQPPSHWQRLVVQDNGMGMNRETRERIFEPFFTTKESGKGTGLGLATVWHLVNEIGGRITIDSMPGDGSIFTLDFPCLEPAADAAVPSTPAAVVADIPTPSSEVPTARILFVEDNNLVAQALLALLTRSGYQIQWARDGNEAWKHISETPGLFDVILTDLNMPGMSGLDFIRLTRGSPYKGKIIVMTGYVPEDAEAAFESLHVDAVLQKPISPRELLETIKDIAAGLTSAPLL